MIKSLFFFFILLSLNSYAVSDSIVVKDQVVKIEQNRVENSGKKILNSFLSLIVPGYNYFIQKKYLKGAVFVANDVLAGVGYYYFNKKGDDKWQETYYYADKHFDPQFYEDFVDTIYNSNRFLINPDVFVFDTLGHVLKKDENGNFIKDLNYYEMIGKYKKFAQGWDDVSPKYEDIISKYGQIYIPITKGDSVLRYGSKYPNANDEDLRTIPDTAQKYFVNLSSLNSIDKQMLIPSEDFFGVSKNAQIYMNMRDDANQMYYIRDYMLWAIFINHLSSFMFSIYDNFISVNNDNNLSFSITPYSSDKFISRGVKLNIQF